MIKSVSGRGVERGVGEAGRGGHVAEYCRAILHHLEWPGTNGSPALRTLGLTSCVRGEGVSTVAAHLALAAAASPHARVLLVDANLDRPFLHRLLRVNASPGLAECLLERADPTAVLQRCPTANLHVLSAGSPDSRSAWKHEADAMAELVRMLRETHDLVVLDLPAADRAGSATRLAGLLDGVLLVVEAEHLSWEAAHRTKETLGRAGVRLVGAVLNKRRI